MKLYQGTSLSIGTEIIIVKAENAKQASEIVRDVIQENHMTTSTKIKIYILELTPPENDGPGYCYPKEEDDKFSYTL
jgi:hypothetical protein